MSIWIELLWVLGGTVVFGLLQMWTFAYAMGGIAGSVAAHCQPIQKGQVIDVEARTIGKE